jgi:sporulation protein YlmC with PRC-barrel domain
MLGSKSIEPNTGFTATLRLPRYFPKEEILGKVVFDQELERVGQAVDWTYTPSGVIALVVSGKPLKEMLKGGDSIIVPFEYIDRVGNFILLSKPIETLIPKEVAIGKEELMERELAKTSEKNGKKKKKEQKGLKAVNELEKEVIDNLIPEVFANKRPSP